MPFAEVDHLLVNAGEGRFRHDCLDVGGAAVGAPHLAADTDHGRHRCVDDHVVRRVEVGDALGRIDHGQLRTVFQAGVQVFQDLVLLRRRQLLDLLVQVDHAVVHVHAQFVEQLGVLLECLLVEDAYAVAEHDRVRHLHHGRFYVQREHHAGLVGVVDFAFVELQQGFLRHEHGVDDLARLQCDLRFQDDGLAGLGQQFHLHFTRLVQGHGLFAVVEVAAVHVRHVGARCLAPFTHRVRILASVFLDRLRCAAVGVAFAQDRVHRGTDALAVAGLQCLFFFGLGVFRVVRQLVAGRLQFAHAGDQLGNRCRNIGQLDDVGVRVLGQGAQFGQVVRHFLFVRQAFREGCQHAGRHRNIAGHDVDAGRCSEFLHDRQQGISRQQWRLVGKGVDDFRLLRHVYSLKCGGFPLNILPRAGRVRQARGG